MRLVLAAGMTVLAVSAAGAATRQPQAERCIAQSGELVLHELKGQATPGTLHNEDAEGRPQRGGKPLKLCKNIPYRLQPIGSPDCRIIIPESGTVARINAIIDRQLPRGCPRPSIEAMTRVADTGSNGRTLVGVVPSGVIDTRYRRQIVVIGEPSSPKPPPQACVTEEQCPLPTVEVPKLIEKTVEMARQEVERAKLPLVVVTETGVAKESDVGAWTVTAQDPAPESQIDAKQRVIAFAAPPPPPTWPPVRDFTNKPIGDARALERQSKRALPLVLTERGPVGEPEAEDRLVESQYPSPGTVISPAKPVTLVARRLNPEPSSPLAPPVVLVGGLASGAAAGEILRRLARRRDPETGGRAPPPAPSVNPDIGRLRARPDLPPIEP